jgi:lysophospholipase L1-like esterase
MKREFHWHKKILILSIALNLLFITLAGYVVVKKGGLPFIKKRIISMFAASIQNDKVHKPYYYQKKSLYELLPNTQNEIIFLGDSLIDHCNWAELFQNLNIKNRGLRADTVDGVLNRLEEIVSSMPAKIFLMVGINDLGYKRNISEIISSYEQIIQYIQAKSPKTEIYVHSVLPLNYKLYKGKVLNEEVIELNDHLRRLSSKHDVIYIDLIPAMSDNNHQLREEYTEFDGQHLNGQGYLIWKSAIEKHVN